MKNFKVFILLLPLLAFTTGGEESVKDPVAEKYAGTIKPNDLEKHLKVLASDEYEGRETGRKGQKMAAEYIANHFKHIGIPELPTGGYLQSYPLEVLYPGGASISINKQSFEFLQDFYYFRGFNDTTFLAEDLLFLGYGIDDKKYSDYKGRDVKGKILVLLEGEPQKKNGKYLISGNEKASKWSGNWRTKGQYASKMGAKAVFIIKNNMQSQIGRMKKWIGKPSMRLLKEGKKDRKYVAPRFYISKEMGNILLKAGGTNYDKVKKQINKKKKPISFTITTDLSVSVKRNREEITAENVLGYIEGSDPKLKEELLIITAHYDHLGTDDDNAVYNGADDDGSGTVALLELAQAFMNAKKNGNGTRRSVLLMAVSGEEKGLLGSEFYADHPVFPLENTVANLNIDMVGRKDEAHDDYNYVYLIGSDKLSSELHDVSEHANSTYTNLSLDYTFNDPDDPNRYYYRSDHYNFAKNNIPVIFYFTGIHEDYHKPTDTVDKIKFDKLATIAQLVFYTGWDITNRDGRLIVDRKNDFED